MRAYAVAFEITHYFVHHLADDLTHSMLQALTHSLWMFHLKAYIPNYWTTILRSTLKQHHRRTDMYLGAMASKFSGI